MSDDGDRMDFLQLAGKTILVFGVANRKSVAFHIGALLEAAGANVVYVVRSPERQRVVAKLLPAGAEIHVCDVEHEDQIARLREATGRSARAARTGWSIRSPSPTMPTARGRSTRRPRRPSCGRSISPAIR